MAATAGPAPWDHEEYWKWRQGYKATNRGRMRRAGVEPAAGGGYRQNTWDKDPKEGKSKRITLFNGKEVQVPDADYEDFIGHRAGFATDKDVALYIGQAYEDPKKDQVDGVGHILDIQYSLKYQLLWVEFETDGAIVVFFRVPKEVYAELYYLAKNKTTRSDGKHLLGVRFWDIVRIRGQRKGSKYAFRYEAEGEYEPKGTRASSAVGAVSKALDVAKTEDADTELKDLLSIYARRLPKDSKRVYDNYKTNSERYSFLRKKGIDLPTLAELNDKDF